MGVEALLVVSETQQRLLARHWGRGTEAQLLLERRLAQLWHTHPAPPSAHARTLSVDGFAVRAQPVGELCLYLVGSGHDGDEHVLGVVAEMVCKLLEEHLEGKLTAAQLTSAGATGKMLVSLDELICDGDVVNMDVDAILKLSKMKSL